MVIILGMSFPGVALCLAFVVKMMFKNTFVGSAASENRFKEKKINRHFERYSMY